MCDLHGAGAALWESAGAGSRDTGAKRGIGLRLDSESGPWRNFELLLLPSMSVFERDLAGVIAAELEMGVEAAPGLPSPCPEARSLGKGVCRVWVLLGAWSPEPLQPAARRSWSPEPLQPAALAGLRGGHLAGGHVRAQKCAGGGGWAGHCVWRALRVPQRETASSLRAVTPLPRGRVRHLPGFHVPTARDSSPLRVHPPAGPFAPWICSPGRQRAPTPALRLSVCVGAGGVRGERASQGMRLSRSRRHRA